MEALVLLSVLALAGVLNLLQGLSGLLSGPYGFALGAVVAGLIPCAFTTFCPLSVLARRLCARVGCRPG